MIGRKREEGRKEEKKIDDSQGGRHTEPQGGQPDINLQTERHS